MEWWPTEFYVIIFQFPSSIIIDWAANKPIADASHFLLRCQVKMLSFSNKNEHSISFTYTRSQNLKSFFRAQKTFFSIQQK